MWDFQRRELMSKNTKARKPVNEQLILSLVTERKRESKREKQYEYDRLELNYGWA